MVEFPKSVASQIPDVYAPIVPVLKCYLWKPLGGEDVFRGKMKVMNVAEIILFIILF